MRTIVGCPDPGSEKRHLIAYVRPQAILPSLAFAGLASDLPGPKTRAAIWSTAAWQSRKRSTPKVFADLIRDHVLSTVSPGSTRPGFGLIQRDNSRVGHWNSSTSMAKFLFQKL